MVSEKERKRGTGRERTCSHLFRMFMTLSRSISSTGIKTVILNMNDVAKALHIHPAYPTKFFGIELGAQSKYSVAEERAVVNGQHQAGDLQKLLDKFIQQFILCPNCKVSRGEEGVSDDEVKAERRDGNSGNTM